MTKRILLTGGTGYLGRHVLSGLLTDGHEVVAIVRPRGGVLEERLSSYISSSTASRLEVLAGDVTRKDCALDASALERLKGTLDAVVHCAGLTEFGDNLEKELREQNTGGTRHTFELCLKLRVPQFHHVSTAFVAGTFAGKFGSRDLDRGQGFRNPYERSKFDAEVFLREQQDVPVICSVYRPSIVVGGRVMGEDGSAGTLYAYLKALRFIRECFREDATRSGQLAARYGVRHDGTRWHIPLRCEGAPDVRVNLIHVRDVVARILRHVSKPPGSSGTYTLVNSSTFTIESLRQVFCDSLNLDGISLVSGEAFEVKRHNPLEEKFRRMTSTFLPYLYGMPGFECERSTLEINLNEIVGEFLAELESRSEGVKKSRLSSIACESLDIEKPSKYIEEFSNGKFGSSLARRIPETGACVCFEIKGSGAYSKTLLFDQGGVRPVNSGEREADFIYAMDETVFRRVVTGELDPREAFFRGELKITGNQELGLKFGFYFSEHFRNIDERILEELESTR